MASSASAPRAQRLGVALILLPAFAACDDSLLKSLPREYARAPWREFVNAKKELVASTKEVKVVQTTGATDGEMAYPKAVVKVVARAKIPVRELLDTFHSEDEAIISEWNPCTLLSSPAPSPRPRLASPFPANPHLPDHPLFPSRLRRSPSHHSLTHSAPCWRLSLVADAGEVQHLDRSGRVMLQTYRMPWPFASREYLVRCEEQKVARGHQAHCASIDAHPSAPLRSDRVRGVSETIWRFVEENDGQTSIHLETLVDPRGGLPTWVVDKVGKSAAVKIVRSLIAYTSERVTRAKASFGPQQQQQQKQQPPSAADETAVAERGGWLSWGYLAFWGA